MTRLFATRTACLVAALVCTAVGSSAWADQSVGGTDDKGGSVTGVVTFEGEKKPRAPVAMAADPYCAKAHAKPPLSERWIFGKNDGLANVLVQVVKGPGIDGKTFKPSDKPLVIDQAGCIYVPHVSAAVAGQKVKFVNSDSTLHNVRTMPRINAPDNIGQPVKGMISDVKLVKPEEAVLVKCDVHAWMTCYVHIVTHPYFAVTDGDGKFAIKGLPPGEYELKIWHEVKAFQPKEGAKLTVKIAEGESTKLDIAVAPAKRN